MTLLDFAENHIGMAKTAARRAGVEMDTLCIDFRLTPSNVQADFAVNMFTSGLGYLGRQDDIVALQSLHAALKPGAKILIDTMNLFWLMNNYIPRGWTQNQDGTVRVFEEREFNFLTGRNHSTTTIVRPNKPDETRELDHHIYSASVLACVLKEAGFLPLEVYGDFEMSPFNQSSKRIIMVALRQDNVSR